MCTLILEVQLFVLYDFTFYFILQIDTKIVSGFHSKMMLKMPSDQKLVVVV